MKTFPDTFWKYATVVSVSALFLLAFRSPRGSDLGLETIRARQFVLVDADGKTVGEWGPDSDAPRGISLRMYDPAVASLGPSVRILAEAGKAELWLAGAPKTGVVWLHTDEASSGLDLLNTCNDPSHVIPLHLGLVTIGVTRNASGMQISNLTPTTVDGKHADVYENLFSVPDPTGRPHAPGGK